MKRTFAVIGVLILVLGLSCVIMESAMTRSSSEYVDSATFTGRPVTTYHTVWVSSSDVSKSGYYDSTGNYEIRIVDTTGNPCLIFYECRYGGEQRIRKFLFDGKEITFTQKNNPRNYGNSAYRGPWLTDAPISLRWEFYRSF
ncbi:MAG: hypothetical protein NT120_00565 [Candidatus Aenigmarchaeota archaeon]|nr:hypothetical protein [Candidatus Aenigmarchaeota archaeon]